MGFYACSTEHSSSAPDSGEARGGCDAAAGLAPPPFAHGSLPRPHLRSRIRTVADANLRRIPRRSSTPRSRQRRSVAPGPSQTPTPFGCIHDGHNFVRSSYGSPPSHARTSQGMERLLLRPSGTHLTLRRDIRRWFVCACQLLRWEISTRCDGGPGANVLSFRRKRVRVSTLFDRCGAQPPRRGRANWDTVAQGKPWSTRLPRTSQLRLLACFI